jgi:ATP-binding cassette subfamily B protein
MKSGSDWALLKRIALQAQPYWLHLSGVVVLSLLSTPVALLTPLPLKIVIDSVFGSQPLPAYLTMLPPLLLAPCLVLGVVLLTYLQGSGSWLLQTYTGEGLALNFRARLFAHVQRLSLSYHDLKGAADSTYRIHYDAPAIQNILIYGFIPLLAAALRLVSMFWVTWALDPLLAVFALGVAPALFLITYVFRRRLRERWSDVRELDSSANAAVQEVLSSVRVVKAFGREDDEHARFVLRSRSRMRELLRVAFLQGTFDVLVGFTIALGMAGTLYIGVLHVRAGELTLGELTLVSAYVIQLLDPLKAVSKNVADLQGGLASAERAFYLLDQVPDVVDRPRALTVHRVLGDIRFEDVDFSYDGKRQVLEGITFDVPAGARVGIRGATGSGKSTLLSLLTRFYDVTNGRILIDGIDVRDYKLKELRNQFALVLQEPVLFSTSIAENIAYGRPGASAEQIVEAAKQASAHDFIVNLTESYATQVGERGMQLSGGERQRIALARAFLKDAPVILLDEPTSALDTRTERNVIEVLERLMRGRTTFMVAHRLGTLENCDIMLEVRNGNLVKIDSAALPLA